MRNSARAARVAVSADGRRLVSQAGAGLLWETMRVTGLGRGPSEGLARRQWPRPAPAEVNCYGGVARKA